MSFSKPIKHEARRLLMRALSMLMLLSFAACGGKGLYSPIVPNVKKGACANPERDGVASKQPRMKAADFDLNSDGVKESVRADRSLCTEDGNCYWNMFRKARVVGASGESCWRYIGTVEGGTMRPLSDVLGEDRYMNVRGWWRMTDSKRIFISEYEFRDGAYQPSAALTCRTQSDDRLECTTAVR